MHLILNYILSLYNDIFFWTKGYYWVKNYIPERNSFPAVLPDGHWKAIYLLHYKKQVVLTMHVYFKSITSAFGIYWNQFSYIAILDHNMHRENVYLKRIPHEFSLFDFVLFWCLVWFINRSNIDIYFVFSNLNCLFKNVRK